MGAVIAKDSSLAGFDEVKEITVLPVVTGDKAATTAAQLVTQWI